MRSLVRFLFTAMAYSVLNAVAALPVCAQALKLSPDALKAFDAGKYAPCISETTSIITAAASSPALREAALTERARCYFFGVNSLSERAAFLARKYQTSNGVEESARKELAEELQAAIADANAAIAINSRNATAYNVRGLVNDRRDLNAEAIADFTTAIGIDPGNWKAVLNRAKTKRKMGDLAESLADLTIVEKLYPQVTDIYLLRAEIHSLQRQLGLSVDDISRAILMEPANPAFLLKRAEYSIRRADYARAAADLKAAVSVDSSLLEYAGKQGDLLMEQGKPEGAVAFFSLLVEANPSSAVALTKRADAQMAAGATEAALADLDKAIALDPNSADPHVVRATILIVQDRGKEAYAEMELLFTRWPFESKVKNLASLTPELQARLDQVQLARYKTSFSEAVAKMRDLGREHQGLVAVHGVRGPYTPAWQQIEDAQRFIELDTKAKYAANDVMQSASGALAILRKNAGKYAAEIATFERGASEALSDYKSYDGNIAMLQQKLADARK